jgi:hypothetical protein
MHNSVECRDAPGRASLLRCAEVKKTLRDHAIALTADMEYARFTVCVSAAGSNPWLRGFNGT